MKRIFLGIICGLIATGALSTQSSALSLAPCPEDEDKAACEARQAELLRRYEAGEPLVKSADQEDQEAAEDDSVAPTFISEIDESQQSAGLWVGKNFLLAGNNLTTTTEVRNGLLFVAGNNLNLTGSSEYGFIFGNIIKFNGATQRDLYIAGNSITLTKDAMIGRDAFIAGSELRVETDLLGDLSVTAERVIIGNDISIAGNVNIDANIIEFGQNVTVGGKLVYNDNAQVNGADSVDYGDIEVYHVQEVSLEARLIAEFYAKFLSIAGLFLVMALIIAIYAKTHVKIEEQSTAGHFGTNLAVGLGALVIVPIVSIFAFLTVVAAPFGIIALALYAICIYLAQGFTGLWLGHIIIEKWFKAKGNPFVEALLGIAILGLLALVPFVGVITGFVSLALGLGLIVNCIRPRKDDDDSTKILTKTNKIAKTAKPAKIIKK